MSAQMLLPGINVLPQITLVLLSPHESECCICGAPLVLCRKGIPTYEGRPVPPEWEGDWCGQDACDTCFEKYERGELPMWSRTQL